MKMKRYLATILAVAATSATLPSWADGETSADVLVWFVDTSEAEEGVGATFDEIKFWAVDPNNNNEKVQGLGGKTYSDVGDIGNSSASSSGSGESISASTSGHSFDGPYYTDISGLTTGYAFLMELYSGGQRCEWMLSPVTLADIERAAGVGAFHVNLSDLDIPEYIEGYNFASTMVPEPTSGLLILIGGALLALRRRRIA